MHQLLQLNSSVQTASGPVCRVESFIGGGGQGEVYRAQLDGRPIALKWYFPEQATPAQRQSLETLIRKGPPSGHFLWPLELVSASGVAGFGYLMPLRKARYKGIVDLMKRRIDPGFRALGMAGLQLAQAFLELHAQGLCYRDIAFGNVFFDPDTLSGVAVAGGVSARGSGRIPGRALCASAWRALAVERLSGVGGVFDVGFDWLSDCATGSL